MLCLLSNAVKYSDGGTVTVSIEVVKKDVTSILGGHVDESEKMVRLSVEDTGEYKIY